MPTQDEKDRREYYRIEDTIALDFRQLSAAEAASQEPLVGGSTVFNLLSELHLLDFESQHMLRHISERDRTLASYLKVINKRFDLLSQAVAQSLLEDIGEPRPVIISEGGVSFSDPEKLQVGTQLAMKIVLMPQALGLMLRAKVVHCTEIATGSYDIGTEFEALTDAQRQLLARHILQRQAHERRTAREQADLT